MPGRDMEEGEKGLKIEWWEKLEKEEIKRRKAIYGAGWYQRNRHKADSYTEAYRDRLRREMVQAYGGECVGCGEDDPVVLVLDHVNDDAQADKMVFGRRGGVPLYSQLRRAGWPRDRYQLMCHNCNFRKEYQRRRNGRATTRRQNHAIEDSETA